MKIIVNIILFYYTTTAVAIFDLYNTSAGVKLIPAKDTAIKLPALLAVTVNVYFLVEAL